MIARLLVRLLGGIWKVKQQCQIQNKLLSKLYKVIYNYYQFEHGSSISYKSKFTNMPTFPRGMKQIVISEDSQIGVNCIIYQQVTIDKDLLQNSKIIGAPIIGDNCLIYPGVKIIGNVIIGDNVIIGANVVVEKNIPSNCIVKVSDD